MIASSLTRPVPLSPHPAVARRQVGRLLGDAGWQGDVDAVTLAVHEALVNSARHAGGATGATASFEGRTLVVEVRDRGRGFTLPDSPAVPDAVAERGRGLFLIRRLASQSEVFVSGHEICLRLRFHQ